MIGPTLPKRDVLEKALQVLWAFVDAEGNDKERGVRDLALRLNLLPATVYRTLASLQRYGLVQQNPESGKYRIGAELYRLSLLVSSRFSLRDVALPVMRDLVAKCKETTFLTSYDASRREMMFVAAVHSNHPLRYIVPMNEWVPVHAGATGLAIMAFLPEEERAAIVAQTKLRPLTLQTITDPSVLSEELVRIRAQGYAISRGQRNIGAVSIAAPLWDPRGMVTGDLAVSIPETRFESGMEQWLARLVLDHAARIMEMTGSRPSIANVGPRLTPATMQSFKSTSEQRSPLIVPHHGSEQLPQERAPAAAERPGARNNRTARGLKTDLLKEPARKDEGLLGRDQEIRKRGG
jgi:IclR family acetate operon transcriptional repressor